MKLAPLLSVLLSVGAVGLANAQDTGPFVGVNGVTGAGDGYIGVYEIADASSSYQYWWMCVEPNGSPVAEGGDSFLAQALTLTQAWDQQNTERLAYYSITDPLATGYAESLAAREALSLQVSVIGYVLDTFLPSNAQFSALLEGSEQATEYGNNNDFYNRMYAVQNFLSELYGKPTHDDFSDFSSFIDRWSGDLSEAGIARSEMFQDILDAVAGELALDSDFFENYITTGQYYIANTYLSESDLDNWQDALIVAVPVPEPSGALLIGCCGLLVMFRRYRKVMA